MNRLLALLALIMLSPVLLVVAVAVGAGGGPVIYREHRLGLGGRAFTIYKFRTLHPDAARDPFVAPAGDARITRAGSLLRRLHIDELPQLVNVLRGDMNIVGPRPARPEVWDGVPADLRRRALAFRPGLTSPASLRHICEDEVLAGYDQPQALYRDIIFPAKVAEDVRYFERANRQDWKVACRTFLTVLRQGRRHECRERIVRMLETGQRQPTGGAAPQSAGNTRRQPT